MSAGAELAHEAHDTHEVPRDYAGAKLGMWLFLFTEVLLFGGMFILYSAQRRLHPQDFHDAGQHLNHVIGIANTFVLLTSSLTMALSITAVQKGNRKAAMALLSTTMLLGLAFLVNKYVEWSGEIHHGYYPGSPKLLEVPGEHSFFALYFTMTGLHGLHVIAGLTVLGVMLVLLKKGRIHQGDYIKLENGGLYWHLVDVIWIFLLPLFYLAA